MLFCNNKMVVEQYINIKNEKILNLFGTWKIRVANRVGIVKKPSKSAKE